MSDAEILAAIWGAVLLAVAAIGPYVLLRIWAKSEDLITALMHSYLPWLATVLVLLGTFGVG